MIARKLVTVLVLSAAAFWPAHLGSAPPKLVRAPGSSPIVVAPFREDRDLGYYLEISITPQQRRDGLSAAKRAETLRQRGDHTAALASYDRAARLLPNLGDWISAFAATVAASAGDTAQVHRRLANLDSLVATDWAWRTRVRAYRNAGAMRAALAQAERAADAEGSLRRRAEAWRMIGELRLELSDTGAASQAFTRAMDLWPYSDVALEAARMLSGLRGLTPQQHLRIGRTYLRYGNEQRGLAGLRAYLASGGAHPDTSARVRLEIGRAFFARDQYGSAARELLALARDYPDHAVAAEAWFLAGRAQYRDGNETEGKTTLERVATAHPQHETAARALLLLGDLAQDDGNVEAASQFFRRATVVGPLTEAAGIAHMRLGIIALSSGNAAEAARRFEQYRMEFPLGARNQQATYWAGVAHGELGSRDLGRARLRAARDADPFSFYGLRAAERLEEPVLRDRLQPGPATAPGQQSAVKAALARLDLMRELEWDEAAGFELQRMKEYFAADTGARYALAEQLNESGRVSAGMTLGSELLRRGAGWDERLMRVMYPFPYRDLIRREANRHGIDPFFAAALIRQESAFNPDAVSAAGAVGLMQVMPSTGRAVARSIGIRRFRTAALRQPETNVRIGTRFLADMVKTWGGRVDKVLAAYNAGPTRMERWNEFPEAAKSDWFLERIPFDETRDYVRVVQLNARIYRTLYGSAGSSGTARN